MLHDKDEDSYFFFYLVNIITSKFYVGLAIYMKMHSVLAALSIQLDV